MHVSREAPGDSAIALIEIDGELPGNVLDELGALPQAKPLRFGWL